MKKNLVRIVALLLVAMLALTLIPMGALAASVDVYEEYHEGKTPEWGDLNFDSYYIGTETGSTVTIKTSDYDKHVIYGNELYDLKGVFDWDAFTDNDDEIKMKSSLTFKDGKSHSVSLGYVPHAHKLSRWYSDGTTHWRECLVCKNYDDFHEKFMYQNWCQDGDEDGICNVCGGDVPYHDVTVIESGGGKITVNKDTASHRTKITADVEVADGYKLKKLHFIKVRDDGSEQEITRYKKDGQFWTRMPTYELKVTAEFVKK